MTKRSASRGYSLVEVLMISAVTEIETRRKIGRARSAGRPAESQRRRSFRAEAEGVNIKLHHQSN